jgi:hypothetical protein
MKNSSMKNHQSVIQNCRPAPAYVRASLLVLFVLMSVFIPTRAFGQNVWTSQDIGTPPTAGSSVLLAGNVVVSGSGLLWGTSDSCQYYYQTLNGDGQIIAKLNSVANQPGDTGKTGLMIRQSLAANSQQVSLLMQGTYGPGFIARATTGGSDSQLVWDTGTTPAWYKLVRSGNTITGYTSPDSITWTVLSSTTISLSTQVYIGLVTGGYVGNDLTASTFSNISVIENDLLNTARTISFDNDAGNVVDIAGNLGNLNFNNSFKEPNSANKGATWSNLAGGLNLEGAVQVVDKTGYVFYDTSVTTGTGANPGTGGSDANMFQNGTFMLSFSLANYASTANEVGVYFRVDSVAVGSGNNGYVIIVNPVASGSNYVFKYSLYATSGYAPSGTALATYTSTTAISNPAAPFYTLGVAVSGSTFTAQIYDPTGASVGGTASFTNSTNANAGMAGFLVSGTASTTGATAYQFAITPTGTAYPAVVWYVQAGASGGNGTFAKPYTTIYQGETAAAATPGAIVQVEDGTYVASVSVSANTIIRSQHTLGAHLEILANYGGFYSGTNGNWTIDGFEISPQTAGATGPGITSGGNHVIVRNCYIHDCGGSGIGLGNGDYRIVYNNIVARNAFTSGNDDSGLSFWGLIQSDSNPGYHSMICNNVFYANNNNYSGATDGEGIIIDDNRNTQSGHPAGAVENLTYTGAYTLIENNLCFNNGGKGIEVFLSNNVDIVDNTVFENCTRGAGAEISSYGTNNVTCVNNIAVTNSAISGGKYPFLAGGGGGNNTTTNYGSNFRYLNNIAYDAHNAATIPLLIQTVTGTQPTFTGNGNVTGTNPGLLNAIGNANLQNINLAYTTDFEALLGLTSTSPAINTATDGFTDWAGAVTPVLPFDLNGDVRPSGGGYDIGAYQYTATP